MQLTGALRTLISGNMKHVQNPLTNANVVCLLNAAALAARSVT